MILDRNRIPRPAAPRPFHFPEFKRLKMENGLEIIFARRNTLPMVSVNLCLKISALLDGRGKEGLANLTAALLTEGTKNRSSSEIAEELESIGAVYGTHADWKALYAELNVPEWHLPRAMEIFSDMLLHPVFPQDEFERVQKELLTERRRVADNPAKLAAERFIAALYSTSRYALPVEGSEQSISRIRRSDVADFYKRYFKPSHAALIVVGSPEKKDILRLAGKYFSDWRGSSAAVLPKLHFDQPQSNVVYLVDKPGAAQCEMRMGHLGLERSNPDYYAVTLMNEILGGFFLSRINMNLREEHAYTYGASSGFSYRPGKGPFSVSAAVHSEHITAAVKEVLKEMRRLQDEKVSAEELDNARGQLIGVFPIAFETTEQVALGLANILVSDLADDYYQTFRDRIAEITREDVQAAAKKYLHPGQTIIVVTGDRAVVEEPLRKEFELSIYNVNGKTAAT